MLGLEEGSFPRRQLGSPFLDDEERREIDETSRRARSTKPDPVSRERYLFYTACTRPSRRLYLVREAATDEGSPREASPFWDEARALFDRAGRAPAGRRAGRSPQLTWQLDTAPTERERLRALSALAAARRRRTRSRSRSRTAGTVGSTGRCGAFERPTRLHRPACSRTSGEGDLHRHRARALRRLLVDLVRRPAARPADDRREVDARLRGSVAHQALYKFFSGLPKRLGVGARRAGQARRGARVPARVPGQAIEGGVWIELTDLQRRELEETLLARPGAVRARGGRVAARARPAQFEVVVRLASAPRRAAGGLKVDGFSLAGKIDRIDVDPFSARAIVQDYKSGKTAHSAAKIESELTPADPALHARAARPRRHGAARRPLPRPRRRTEGARTAARGAPRRSCRASRSATTSTRRSSGRDRARRRSTRSLRRADPRRATSSTTRRAAPLPELVRPVADVPGGESPSSRTRAHRTPSSSAASTRPGSSSSPPAPARARRRCSSSASCARSATDGLPIDSVLAITYTERAAGELRGAHPRSAARA